MSPVRTPLIALLVRPGRVRRNGCPRRIRSGRYDHLAHREDGGLWRPPGGYTLAGPGSDHVWSNDSLAVGYRVPANVSPLLIAYVDGELAGADAVGPYRKPVTAEGDRIEIGRELSGNHAVRVAVYRDANGDDEVDPGTDPACKREDEWVHADRRTIDFDRFDGEEGVDDRGTKAAGDRRPPRNGDRRYSTGYGR